MRVLVACEFSGTVREAFAAKGHDAWSCDILPTERPGNHLQGDVRHHLKDGWDLMICHPPCTHLAVSGARWFPQKQKEQREALEFVLLLMNAPIPMICLENPLSVISSYIGPPTQIVHPWQFGESFEKTTCLWLKNLRPLRQTHVVHKGEFRVYKGKKFAEWYMKARNDKEGSGKARSKTFEGIARAMADQWTGLYRRTSLGLFDRSLKK